jgi:radical SAM protein with 4Fe4S-binding SPASM domain
VPDTEDSENTRTVDHLYLEVTGRCNLNCSHCAVRSWDNGRPDPEYEALAALLESFRAQGGRFVTLSGGEPGLRSDLPDLVAKAASLGLSVTLYTNGLAVTEGVLDGLADASGLLAISLDGPDSDTHERMRGPGTYARTLGCLERAVARLGGERVMLSSILSKPLLPHTHKLWDIALSYGVTALYLGMFEPLKAHSLHPLSPRAHELIDPVLWLLDAADREVATRVLFSESHDLISAKPVFSVRDPKKILGRTVKVQADGWALPGPFFYEPRFHLGKPAEHGWPAVLGSRVYSELEEQARSRVRNVHRCSTCFWASRCGGGSLALTWAAYGKWTEACPLCELYRATLERAAIRSLSNETHTVAG